MTYIEPYENEFELYKCGFKAGHLVRLKKNINIKSNDDKSTEQKYCKEEIWVVLFGYKSDPDALWLRQADGQRHIWDDNIRSMNSQFEIAGYMNNRYIFASDSEIIENAHAIYSILLEIDNIIPRDDFEIIVHKIFEKMWPLFWFNLFIKHIHLTKLAKHYAQCIYNDVNSTRQISESLRDVLDPQNKQCLISLLVKHRDLFKYIVDEFRITFQKILAIKLKK